MLRRLHHLAFITPDMTKTTHFYRDLLGMELSAGIGHDGYRHYFFKFGQGDGEHVAFFEYEGATIRERKFHGEVSMAPLGFDHVALAVDTVDELYALKDTLEAAGVEVTGPVDHGTIWSIYFFDPNNIALEAAWQILEVTDAPAIVDDDPMPVAAEGPTAVAGRYPQPTKRTPRSEYGAHSGNGHPMREALLADGKARAKPEYAQLMAELADKK